MVFFPYLRNLPAHQPKLWLTLAGITVACFFGDPATRLLAQSGTFYPSAELGGFASTSSRTPFWLRANQWGRVPLVSPAGFVRLGLRYQSPGMRPDSALPPPPVHWEFGTEAVRTIGQENRLLLPEVYAKIHWKKWELMAGRERELIGIVDSTLSSGSYSWSGNALPIPKIRLGLIEYVPLGFLKNFISIKGSFVHGWFNDPYIQGAYLHQKTLYGRFGKPEANVHVQLGLVHNATWGGRADYLKDNLVAVNGKLTTRFGDYLTGVILARIPRDRANSRFTVFDGTNRVGNHVGHYDLAVDWKLRDTKFLFYRQHPFEDASGLQLQNLPDGLYGISVRRNKLPTAIFAWKGILVEFLSTRDQSGSAFDLTGSRFKGLDNYFNHAQYRQGWSYLSRGIGTPFIPPRPEVRPTIAQTLRVFSYQPNIVVSCRPGRSTCTEDSRDYKAFV